MILDVIIDNESLSIDIEDPFHPDINALFFRIEQFVHTKGTDISSLDIKELILRMIKGTAGCERGCPADAKGIVSQGFEGFALEYIEGGILSADALLCDGRSLALKMFPDF
ncbi:MAG: hypothetical protein HZB31_09715 [Nitrospirae bacterium]|nr:hypothetical protein [Nitrospirota bacterium]